MAIVELQVVLEERLNCGRCDGILIQVDDPALLLINDGAPVEDLKTFIRGNVVEFEEVALPGNCNIAYRYTISYDDVLLADPLEPLRACDIERICCADCLFDYLDEIDFGFTLESTECGLLTVTAPDGSSEDVTILTCTNLPIFGEGTAANPIDVLLSTDLGNSIVLGTDSGLYVSNTALTVDTALPITGDGSGGNPIDLLLSADAGNIVVLGTDSGVYAPEAVTTLPIQGSGTLANPVDLLLSTDFGNAATLGTDSGLYVAVTGGETITTLANNGNNTSTYTSENATVTVINYAYSLSEPVANTVRLTKPNGAPDDVVISVNHTLTEPVPNTIRLTRPDGTFDSVVVSFPAETVTTLTLQPNNIFRYTNEAGTITNINMAHTLTRPTGTTFRLTEPDGTFSTVTVTDTTLTGAVGFIATGLPEYFAASVPPHGFPIAPYTSNTSAPLTITAPATRGLRSDVTISARPNFVFDPSQDSQITFFVEYSEDGGAFVIISSFTYRYMLPAGTLIARSEPILERLFFFIAAGTSKTIEMRVRLTSASGTGTSRLVGVTGGLGHFSSTV